MGEPPAATPKKLVVLWKHVYKNKTFEKKWMSLEHVKKYVGRLQFSISSVTGDETTSTRFLGLISKDLLWSKNTASTTSNAQQ